ncbi:PAS domain-containing protein [Xanthobacter sp. AM11]|uniref:PAS domain-containing protein n=1 Tax=Xanthobacter sp. AM11 TaxID=3380643 RepID=UPI0039BEEE3A
MTTTSARPLPGPQAALSPLGRDDLASFLVALPSALVLHATAACAGLGVSEGTSAPAAVARAARDLGRIPLRSFGFARLRLPGSLAPRLFRYAPLALPAGPAVLFADPAAFRNDGAPAPRVSRTLFAPPVPAEFSTRMVQPQRITFETDADGRLTALSPLLAQALGARADAVLGRTLAALEADGTLMSDGAAAQAMAAGECFADLRVRVPAQAVGEVTLDLDIGGVPLRDGAGRLRAFRGFGVLRAAPAATARRPFTPDPMPVAAEGPARDAARDAAFGENVVPLRGGSLSPQERSAFREIARTLAAAIEDWPKPPTGAAPEVEPESDGDGEPEAIGAPAALREADLLDRLPMGLVVQQDGEIAYANRTFLAWTGWSELDDLCAAGGLDAVLGREANGALLLNGRDGARMPADVRLVAAPFLGRPALLHVVRRLEPQPDREERAVARREALDMVPWPVFLLEAEGTIRLANRAAGARLGFAPDELAGEPFTAAIFPQERAAAVAALDRAAAQGGSLQAELVLRNRAGDAIRVRAGLTRAGADDQLLCVVVGDTEPGPAAPPDDLLPRLARRMMDRLSAPMATALAFADSPAADDDAMPGPVREALASLRRSLGDLAALAAHEAPPVHGCVDVAALVRDTLAAIAPAARRRHVALRPDLPDEVSVVSDAPRLSRLVRLMIEDAVAATPAGGAVSVSLCVEPGTAGGAVLQVCDGGPALDEVSRAAALDPLQGGAPDGTDRFSAAGLPLRAARLKAEAEALGAGFSLRPDLARGMIARLALPA